MNALEFRDISVVYGEGTPLKTVALNNINIALPEGEVIGIIGHTGSGKSTLAMLTNGLLKPSSGKVLLFGKDIWETPREIGKVRSQVGLVFQYPEYQLFEETVADDIAFGPKNLGLDAETVKVRVEEAAKFCGITASELRKSPFELSGGQKRRAAIAGVVAMRPKVLVLDEPAAGLDPSGREDIFGGLLDYRRETNATMLIISHSMEDIANYADRILVIKNGDIYMYGTTEEVFMQAEKLFDASLDLPQITKLFLELEKRGICESRSVYTINYAKKQLLAMLAQRGKKNA